MQQYSKNANIYKYTKIHKMYNIKNARYTKKQIPRHTTVPQTCKHTTNNNKSTYKKSPNLGIYKNTKTWKLQIITKPAYKKEQTYRNVQNVQNTTITKTKYTKTHIYKQQIITVQYRTSTKKYSTIPQNTKK